MKILLTMCLILIGMMGWGQNFNICIENGFENEYLDIQLMMTEAVNEREEGSDVLVICNYSFLIKIAYGALSTCYFYYDGDTPDTLSFPSDGYQIITKRDGDKVIRQIWTIELHPQILDTGVYHYNENNQITQTNKCWFKNYGYGHMQFKYNEDGYLKQLIAIPPDSWGDTTKYLYKDIFRDENNNITEVKQDGHGLFSHYTYHYIDNNTFDLLSKINWKYKKRVTNHHDSISEIMYYYDDLSNEWVRGHGGVYTTCGIISVPELPSEPHTVLSIDYFDLYGRKIPKPKQGFYIERKLTKKGIISTKYFKK